MFFFLFLSVFWLFFIFSPHQLPTSLLASIYHNDTDKREKKGWLKKKKKKKKKSAKPVPNLACQAR